VCDGREEEKQDRRERRKRGHLEEGSEVEKLEKRRSN
jgi:hypothetical protein